jgi:hypothetical protein
MRPVKYGGQHVTVQPGRGSCGQFHSHTLLFSGRITDIVQLVLALYEPRPPDAIAGIQESLQQLQKSPAGWQLAQNLLMQPDDKVKFFGALTMIVKLNTER